MIQRYFDIFVNAYSDYASYLWNEITHPTVNSYFYWLIAVSLFFFALEVAIPWRRNQAIVRRDFWLDAFYMFFNFFIFTLIIYNAASDVIVNLFNDGIYGVTGWDMQKSNPLRTFPMWSILLIGFLVRDFVQWWIHRLLHKVEWLWNFHKVHHSVEQMGFAAHLRYHWMENVVYRSLEYLPLALLGIGLYDFFIIHIFTLAWGHYNHSNISISSRVTGGILGGGFGLIVAFGYFDVNLLNNPSIFIQIISIIGGAAIGVLALSPVMKKLFNSPEMHIWHHAYNLPADRRNGVNFGLTLAIWDYIFNTAYIPKNGQDIKLGFPGIDHFPSTFIDQVTHGIGTVKSKNK